MKIVEVISPKQKKEFINQSQKLSIYKAIGAEQSKVDVTYRYLLDRDTPFVLYKDKLAEMIGQE